MNGSSTSPHTVSLRPFSTSNLQALFEWAADEKAARFFPWEAYNSKDETILPDDWLRTICVHNRPIGVIYVTLVDRHQAKLGFLVASTYQGRGFATVAVRKAVRTIFKESHELERMEALVDMENFAAQKVLEKAGFAKEAVLGRYWMVGGEARDVIVYSIRAELDGWVMVTKEDLA